MRIAIHNEEHNLTLHLPTFLARFAMRKDLKNADIPFSKEEWKTCMKAIRRLKKKGGRFRLIEVHSNDGVDVTIDI